MVLTVPNHCSNYGPLALSVLPMYANTVMSSNPSTTQQHPETGQPVCQSLRAGHVHHPTAAHQLLHPLDDAVTYVANTRVLQHSSYMHAVHSACLQSWIVMFLSLWFQASLHPAWLRSLSTAEAHVELSATWEKVSKTAQT